MASYVTTPSTDEIEAAWFELMQGELGVEHDRRLREWLQATVDLMRDSAAHGQPLFGADDLPIGAVSSTETARRLVAAYAALFYGTEAA
jgi:hypothetical protein